MKRLLVSSLALLLMLGVAGCSSNEEKDEPRVEEKDLDEVPTEEELAILDKPTEKESTSTYNPGKPEGMLDSTYDAAISTMQIVEDYKDEKITGDKAWHSLTDQKGRLERLNDSEEGYKIQDAIKNLEKIFSRTSRNIKKIDKYYNIIEDVLNE